MKCVNVESPKWRFKLVIQNYRALGIPDLMVVNLLLAGFMVTLGQGQDPAWFRYLTNQGGRGGGVEVTLQVDLRRGVLPFIVAEQARVFLA